MEMFVKCSGLQSSLDRFLPRNGEMENCMISTRYQATRNGLFFFFFFPAIESCPADCVFCDYKS
jgi:hypothetical protein